MFAVKGILPSGRICVVRTMRSHRDARRYMLKREGELKGRFGISLYVGGV